MGLPGILRAFKLEGDKWLYGSRFIRNRIEFTAEPQRVKEFSKQPFTRSQMTMDMLTRFHLSNQSIVVSNDEHADFLKKIFRERAPSQERYAEMARQLVEGVLPALEADAPACEVPISSALIRSVYINLLTNMLGVQMTRPLLTYLREVNLQPGSRPMHMDGVLYALGVVLPRFAPMRKIVDLVVYKGEHRTRRIASELEQLLFGYAVPTGPDTWYADLLRLKASGKISTAQFRGEITSMLVSAFSLSAAMSSMLLCLAARSEYVSKIRADERLLKCFVSEVLRLYPPFRQFGYEPKGIWNKARKEREESGPTDLIVTIYALHRNSNEWADPNDFRPERFLVPKASGGHKYLPFGMGKRACSGRTYSMVLLSHVLRYVCSDSCPVALSLPEDFRSDPLGLPIGLSGVLISFPVDDRVLCRPKAMQ